MYFVNTSNHEKWISFLSKKIGLQCFFQDLTLFLKIELKKVYFTILIIRVYNIMKILEVSNNVNNIRIVEKCFIMCLQDVLLICILIRRFDVLVLLSHYLQLSLHFQFRLGTNFLFNSQRFIF